MANKVRIKDINLNSLKAYLWEFKLVLFIIQFLYGVTYKSTTTNEFILSNLYLKSFTQTLQWIVYNTHSLTHSNKYTIHLLEWVTERFLSGVL